MNINFSSRSANPIGIFSTLACMLLAVSFSGAAVARPDNWAIPLAIDTGVPNLNRVTENLYRSAQPTKEGFVFLSKLPVLKTGDRPVKTIISLRAFNDDGLLFQETPRYTLNKSGSKPGTLKMRM